MTTTPRHAAAAARRRPLGERGNILIYVLMTMVVFGFIGVTMVALFSTSISSSAAANETRRAFYLAESGIRYAAGELSRDKSELDRLNTTKYKLSSGEFDVSVFYALFFSPMDASLTKKTFPANSTVPIEIRGKIPYGFFEKNLPAIIPDLYIVAVSSDLTFSDASAKVVSFSSSANNYKSFEFVVSDDFQVMRYHQNKKQEIGIIGLAVRPLDNVNLTESSNLDLPATAKNIFPKSNGSFKLRGNDYIYTAGKDLGDRFRLYDVRFGKGAVFTPVVLNNSSDYIILNYNNYSITARGTYGSVTYDSGLDYAFNLTGELFPTMEITISDMQQNETSSDYFGGGTDDKGNYLQIGSAAGMGAMWYNQDINLGGSTDYCTSAADINSRRGCFFGTGMRAFFTLEYSGTGEGLVFALMNGQLNQFASAGGDFEAPELLGYAGDSRTNNSGGFLDTTGIKGLRPPKMGLELDAKRNWDPTFETKPTDFCSGGALRQNTRNDPEPGSATKDFVQYVYWGSNSVNASCRPNPNSYDDNRHNASGPLSDQSVSLNGVVNTSPVVTADGKTVYVASNNSDINPTVGRLYAIDLDAEGNLPASVTPFFVGSNGVTSPVLDAGGNIYVGAGNALYALRANRTLKFSFTLHSGTRASTPVIGPDGTIYVSAYDGVKFGYLYAIRPNGALNSEWATNPQPIQFYSAPPVLTPDGSLIIAPSDTQRVYALRTSDGLPDANWGLNGVAIGGVPKNAPAVGPGATAKGTVYIGADDRRVYALSGADGSTILTSPVIATDGLATPPVVAGGTVYVGSFDDNLYALDTSNLSVRWSFPAVGNVQSRPAIDSNGTVYFGSDIRDPFIDNRNVNALYPDGTVKWQFSTGSGDVRGTPAVRPDGSVYIGSFNFNFYAINQFAVPKSLKDKSITYDAGAVGGVPVAVDNTDDWLKGSSSKGPWAVRMEVYRSASANTSAPVGYYKYLLRTWVRQCQQASCSDELGTFYDNTHLTYSPVLRPPQMEQTINLSSTENLQFQRFIFGFTSQTASGDNQRAVIRDLKLGFVRSSDPTVTCDPDWPAGTTCP
jgi:outer membrane protein assembly factor BamB